MDVHIYVGSGGLNPGLLASIVNTSATKVVCRANWENPNPVLGYVGGRSCRRKSR